MLLHFKQNSSSSPKDQKIVTPDSAHKEARRLARLTRDLPGKVTRRQLFGRYVRRVLKQAVASYRPISLHAIMDQR
jgi:hypothetical protein